MDFLPRWKSWFVVLVSVVLSVVSASGQPWVLRQTPNGILSYRAVAGDANECVAVGTEGVIISRKAGGPWAPEAGTGLDLNDIVRGPDEFVAVGASGKVALFLRTDIQYGMRTSTTVGNGTTLNSIAWNGSRYMIVGNDGVSYRSSGSSAWGGWSQVTTGTTKHLYGVGWTGSYWVAVGQDGTILRASSTGSWSATTSPTTDDLRQLATGGGVVVAVGERGVVVTSSRTASTWTRRQYSTLYYWWDIVWDGGKFLATADFGQVFASVDGVSWSGESRGVGANLLGIAMAGGTAVAVGDDTVAERGEISWKRVAGNPAAGGPIQRMNGQFVMPVVGGTIAFSDDGHIWEEVAVQDRPSVLVTNSSPHWKGIVWTGTRYVGAGGSYLYASEDGSTWSKTTPYAVIGQYSGLAWNGELVVAVGGNGFLQTSTDGLTWTTRDTGPAEEDFSDVLWTGSRWVAVGLYRIFSSEDGITWNERYSAHPQFLRKLEWTGSQALVTSSASGILRSTDGLTWSTAALGQGTFPAMGDLYLAEDRWLAYAYATRELYASDDGGTLWNKTSYAERGEWVDPAPANSQISRFGTALWGFENETAIPLGDATPRSRSINGLHWDGSQVIAVGSQGAIRRSTDGITWRWHGTSATEALYGVTKSADTWVAVGFGGRIVRSVDGSHWEVASSGSTEFLRGVAWTGSLFVAVGTNGSILTSPDGLAWTPRDSGVSIQLLAVASNGSGVVVTGTSGNVLFSPDGITWSSVPGAAALTTFNLPWVLWTGSHFVSQIIQSTDGLNWEHLPKIPPIVAACGWNGHEFLFGGNSLWRSTDLTDYSGKPSGSPRPATAIEWMGDRWIVAGNGGAIITSGGYSSWQETEGIPAWKQVAGGDANADGVPDLIAYASGLPGMTTLTAAQRGMLPKLTWEPYRSRWEFQFSRLSQVPPGLRYHIEESPDLRTWNRLGSFAIDQSWPPELGISDTGPMFSPTHTVGLPINFSEGPRFWRIQVDP